MNLKKWIEFRWYLEDISKGLYGHLGRDDGWKWWEIYEKVFLNGLDQAWILQDSHRMTEKIASWSEIRDGKKLEQRGWKECISRWNSSEQGKAVESLHFSEQHLLFHSLDRLTLSSAMLLETNTEWRETGQSIKSKKPGNIGCVEW